MKRIVWLLIAIILLCNIATVPAIAAIDPTTLTPYTILWYSVGRQEPDFDLVLGKINEYLGEKINATLELRVTEISEHLEKLALITAAREAFDVTFVDTQYASYVAQEAFYPLKDILPEYAPYVWETYPTGLWDAVTINGDMYAVPTHKYSCSHILFNLNVDASAALGIDATTVGDWNSFLQYLYDMKAAGGDLNGYVTSFNPDVFFGRYPQEAMTGNLRDPGTCIIGDQSISGQEHNVVFNAFETPEFEQFVRDAYALGQAGVLPKDPDTSANLNKFDPVVYTQDSMAKRTPGYEATYGVKFHTYFTSYAFQTTDKIYGSMNAISDTSKNPERALMMLNAIIEDEYLANLLFYGIEDLHWKRLEDGRADLNAFLQQGETARWYIQKPLLPGFMTATPDTSLPADMVARYNAFGETLVEADNLGFALDETPIMIELAAIRNVTKEYLDPLIKGLSDPDVNLPKFLQQLKAAGVETVLAEQQSQLDAWRAVQGYDS